MYDVYATDLFIKELRKLEKQIQRKVDSKIETLKNNPQIGEKLKGLLNDCWRVEIDTKYRLVYRIHTSQNRIELIFIGLRKKVYKKLERLRRKELI